MPCVRTKIFKSNKSQAVHLAKAIAFPDSVVDIEITAVGNKRINTPAGHSWDDWFDARTVSSDSMLERDQPQDQMREPL